MNKKIIITGIIVLILVGGYFFLQGNGDQSSESNLPPSQQNEVMQTIVIQGHQISKGNITVDVGTTIRWENKDSFAGLPYNRHTITTGVIDPTGSQGIKGVVPNSGSGIPDNIISQALDRNDSFSFTFEEPGEYTFYIAEHPLVSGEGKITVRVTESSASEEVISMEARSFSFSPNTIQAKVGEPVRIDITSVAQHTFTVDELGINVITPHGQITEVEFTPDTKGTFQFYCSVPGHREAGQIGTITVE